MSFTGYAQLVVRVVHTDELPAQLEQTVHEVAAAAADIEAAATTWPDQPAKRILGGDVVRRCAVDEGVVLTRDPVVARIHTTDVRSVART